jgi:hypothetical protein
LFLEIKKNKKKLKKIKNVSFDDGSILILIRAGKKNLWNSNEEHTCAGHAGATII